MMILAASLLVLLQLPDIPPRFVAMPDDAALEGRWELVSLNLNDKVQPKPMRSLLIYGYIWTEVGQYGSSNWLLDRVATSPYPSFSRWLWNTPDPDGSSSARSGLYRVKGDEFRFVYNVFRGKDPAGMEPAKGRGVEIYHRVVAAEPAKSFHGRWRLISKTRDGEAAFAHDRIVSMDGDRWTDVIDEVESPEHWKVKRGDGNPWPTIDIERRVSLQPGKTKIEHLKGIYKFTGKTLTIAYGEERPKTMEPGKGRTTEFFKNIDPLKQQIDPRFEEFYDGRRLGDRKDDAMLGPPGETGRTRAVLPR